MKRIYFAVPVAVLGCAGALAACSGDDITTQPGTDAGHDGSLPDSSTADSSVVDSNMADTTPPTDSTCPSTWTATPDADPSLQPEAGLGTVVLHGQVLAGNGTQDYVCEVTDSGVAAVWTLVGPEAQLTDCHGTKYIQHFASDGGATRPEWFTAGDTSYVIGKKLVTFTPDGGSGAVPWLLLQEVSNGGAGPVSTTKYVQRLYTGGGNAPAAGCAVPADVDGGVAKVPYTADYYFFGP